MREKPTKGTKGFLLYSPFTDKYFFRVYNEDKTYKDYELWAEDIEIEIIDEHTSLKESEKGNRLDYSSKVLGKTDADD